MKSLFTGLLTVESNSSSFSSYENNFNNISSNAEVSFFAKSDKNEKDNNWSIIEKINFTKLLTNRSIYLDSLSSLNKNWIDGNSELPDVSSLNIGKMFLSSFAYLINTKKNIPIPKVIMGPIPSGGLCFELHINKSNAMYITIFNGGTIDIDIKYYDYYSSAENNKDTKKIIEKYELLSE